ncbi:MAG: 2Fe-2S iron-sulfur cluster binding domain-containing protein [Lachnospiraceae bacterium]|nr:2Fe-2S iron-sulfur cluster binding domain-containing protein [Lachnospiraceae bacterium]
MVNITIDNIQVSVPEGTTIMEAAAQVGVDIPKLCFLKEINEIGACRVCVVEVEGKDKLIASCNNIVEEGMVVYTNSAKVRKHRKTIVRLILSHHDCNCSSCVRNQNCALQTMAKDLNILMVPYKKEIPDNTWDRSFPLIKEASKCIDCMRCINVCEKVQAMNVWDLLGTGSRTQVSVAGNRSIREADCALCGQCITHCPVGALRERDDTTDVWHAIEDESKITVVQVAPAVRTAWAENYGLDEAHSTMGHMTDALKRMGFDYVFDTTFSADLTIMEEGTEFISRFTSGDTADMPMFTSCCPGWLRMLKAKYPNLVGRLSTAKSPQQMFGAVMKSYFAESIGVKPENIVTVSIMPCVAKKEESTMELFHGEYAGHDVDIVLTTRELNRMMATAHIAPDSLEKVECDDLMHDITGAGVIFGASGGVMEAALRSAHYLITGENPDPDTFKDVRSTREVEGYKEAEYHIGDTTVRAAVVSGLGNAEKLIEKCLAHEVHYDFVEVMACPGGCVGGGGQPIHDGEELATSRGAKLYELDRNEKYRFSHENPDVQKLYENYFEKPNSHKAHMLLHTTHRVEGF